MPAPMATPWSRGPAATSTPGVLAGSGCPCSRLFKLRKVRSSSTGKIHDAPAPYTAWRRHGPCRRRAGLDPANLDFRGQCAGGENIYQSVSPRWRTRLQYARTYVRIPFEALGAIFVHPTREIGDHLRSVSVTSCIHAMRSGWFFVSGCLLQLLRSSGSILSVLRSKHGSFEERYRTYCALIQVR